MTNLVLFESEDDVQSLLPFTFTRPIAEIRVGTLSIREKWEKWTGQKVSNLTRDYLQKKFPAKMDTDNLFINGTIWPADELVNAILQLEIGDALVKDGRLIACRARRFDGDISKYNQVNYNGQITQTTKPWHIFSMAGQGIESDFQMLTKGRKSAALSSTVTVIGNAELVFMEEGAVAEACTFNTKSGPIYIGADAEVMEGSHVRGPFSLGEHSQLKLGTKIYGPTVIGPHCKVGGEVNNSVIFGYSNKAHDGFLGNSVIGEWCNLGADSNNSNLKNNYAPVKLWSYQKKGFVNTGLQFCGLFMGDHSKCGINTMFNTGTVVGVSANIFGAGFPRNFIPSFAWGGAQGFSEYRMKDAAEVAQRVFERRGLVFDEVEMEIFDHVFHSTADFRSTMQ